MSYYEELNILGIKTNLDELHYKELRSAYLKKSLKYHPDKNNGDDQEFKKIVNAYEVLHEQLCMRKQARGDTETKTNYNSILEEIINEIKWNNLNKQWSAEFIGTTIQSILKSVVGNSFKIFDNLDNNLSLEIYDFLVKFNTNSGIIDEGYMEKLKKILQKKKGYIIILQPSINDLLEDKIYKLEYKDKFYYVPLWHNELIFDNTNESDENLIVKVIPELSNNIFIDDDNNIKYNITLNTKDIIKIFNLGYLEIKLGEKQIIIPSYKINIGKNHQFFKYENGIIKMNEINIFDSSKRSSIIIELELILI